MNNDGTIQQDVSGTAGHQVVTSPQQQQRDKTFSEILARSEEELDRQIAGNIVTTEPTVQVVDDPARFKVRVKVDGEEKELLIADVVTGYQKNEVASERLRKASERGREMDAREETLKNLEAQLKLQTVNLSQPDNGDTKPNLQVEDDLQVQLKSVVSEAFGAMVDGDTEAATKLLVDAIVKGRPVVTPVTTPPVDPQQIAAQVRETLNSEQVWEEFVRDNPEFREEFDDQGNAIVSKQREYGDFIYTRDFAPRVARGEISYQEALTSTAKSVRDTFSPGIQPQPEPELSGTEQRQQRKAAIDNIAIAAGARSAGPVEEKEESRAEVLTNMRKARGLPA